MAKLTEVLDNTKKIVNKSEATIVSLISKISTTLSNELELYKLLIFKETNSEKVLPRQK